MKVGIVTVIPILVMRHVIVSILIKPLSTIFITLSKTVFPTLVEM
jgi:hypothetical protein